MPPHHHGRLPRVVRHLAHPQVRIGPFQDRGRLPDVPPDISDDQKEIYGHLSVGSKPVNGAMVFINERLQDQVTPFRFRLKAGQYIVRVQMTDGSELSKTDTVEVAADSTSKLIFDFDN